ncbi:cytokinesis protein 3 [Podila minutissima]|uniref:Cytokinesis protein 3 n=1 Tax=Podila minutissima TaxID=64525 RepID=A0A9P5SL47_9FUNG|nr:cytokinesis protein 3 [Podila minutissima]
MYYGGWWKGSLVHNNDYGSFPSNFVERISTNDNSNEDAQEGALSPIRPLSRQQHARHPSTESRFAKRKPVNAEDTKRGSTPTTKSPNPGPNASNVPVSNATSQTERRKNPQAILPDSAFEDRSPAPTTSTTTPQFQRLAPRFGPRQTSDGQRSTRSSQLSNADKADTPKGKKKPPGPKEPSIPTGPSIPGAYLSEPQAQLTVEVTNQAVYNPNYSEQQKHQKHATEATTLELLNPSGPNKLSATGGDMQLNNRYSMPNLADGLNCQGNGSLGPHQIQENRLPPAPTLTPGRMHPHESSVGPRTSGTQSAHNLPMGARIPEHDEFGLPKADQDSRHGHNNSEDASQHFQPGMMPRSATEYHDQGFDGSQMSAHALHAVHPLTNNSYGSGQMYLQQQQNQLHLQQQHLQQHRHSTANIQPLSQPYPPIGKSELSLENLEKHNRSQSTLDAPKPGPSQAVVHGRSRSQVNLRPEGSAAFNPYDHQSCLQQQQYRVIQQGHAPINRPSMCNLNPSIVIPPRSRQHLSHSHCGSSMPPGESTNTTSPTTYQPYIYSPDTPTSASTATSAYGDLTSPSSAGTSMSRASVLGGGGLREQRRKSEAMMRPKHSTTSTLATRRFSDDTKQLLASVTTATVTAMPSSTLLSSTSFMDPDTADIDMSAYTAKKPKTTLIRAFKQILNPKKVAEKDAIKNQNEHFAWVEMQKSLKRVSSPEPTLDNPFFTTQAIMHGANASSGGGMVAMDEYSHQDPFEVLKRSHVMRDAAPTGNTLDFGPGVFVQVDKVARNINQRGPHMTPQLLSQKYLTRPYSKSPLFKLRVLFVWVSENIRLEGGPTRDVSGGRYKLGPAGDHLAAAAHAMGGLGSAANSPSSRPGSLVPPAAVFMTGIEEYSRGFLQEDSPELAQDVLTSRFCKTGEGFANLFAEMALAAGIEDVGVVKGYIRGPMDVFSKDVPPPNHAWNVVRIDGTYRFIDCCLASPYHPAHYPNRPSGASPFYFLTSPMDLVLSHFPTFLTYQYIAPAIPPHVFVRLPFVRPAFFEYGLNLVDFKKRTRLEIKDDQPIEVVIRIDGGGNGQTSVGSGSAGGASVAGGVATPMTSVQGLFGGECLGKGCGEGIELRAEVEAMTSEGKVIRKRGLAQIMIWNPYYQTSSSGTVAPATMSTPAPGAPSGSAVTTSNTVTTMSRLYQGHHCTGIRIAKIKAVLPAETVMSANGVRKGVVHIYAGRKVENAPTDATPYSLALSLPITHTGIMPKTPFNFVLPHFSPYEFYVKAPQSELLYYPHTYSFCVVSLAAQAQSAAASAAAVTEAEMNVGASTSSANNSANNTNNNTGPMSSLFPRHTKSSSMAPLPLYRGQSSTTTSSIRSPPQAPVLSTSVSTTSYRNGAGHPYQHQHYSSVASTSSLSVGGVASASPSSVTLSSIANGHNGQGVPRPERMVLRTQTNRIYKLVYDPLRQCHEAKVAVKERGIWECVRMDEGGKSRVGREGTGGVVIASWKCV